MNIPIIKNDKKKVPQDVFIQAYKTKEINILYNMLFCDNFNLYKENFNGELAFPWSELFLDYKSRENLEKIVNGPKHEARVKILAYNELRRLGVKSRKKELLGVIVEVGMGNGLDTLAAYVDSTARYINYSEKIIVWENAADNTIRDNIIELIHMGEQIVSEIGPWDNKRLPQPKERDCRLTFLVSDGLYFGQGEFESLLKDPLGGALLNSATKLMNLLVKKNV